MRLTQICLRQHIGRMFKRHWVVQGKKVPIDNGSISELAKLGIYPEDAVEFVSGKRKIQDVPKIDLSGVPQTFRKSNLKCQSEFLIEGLAHAGNLTKTAVIDHLPAEVQRSVENVEIAQATHEVVRRTILRDHLFEYRPFKVDSIPMTLPRLIECCERMVGGAVSLGNKVTKNTYFSVPVRKNGQTLSFEAKLDHVVWRKPSASENYNLATPEAMQKEVPSIAPLDFSASLFANNEDIALNYPINLAKMQIHPQMIVLRSRPEEMRTFHETPADESQFMSRALMSSFVVAASTAASCYGANVKRLPKPIVIHSVLNHENRFYFGCFQLNTLDLNEAADEKQVKNLWFHTPSIEELYNLEPPKVRNPVFPHHREIGEGDLFKLYGYNERVLRHMFAQYTQFSSVSREQTRPAALD